MSLCLKPSRSWVEPPGLKRGFVSFIQRDIPPSQAALPLDVSSQGRKLTRPDDLAHES